MFARQRGHSNGSQIVRSLRGWCCSSNGPLWQTQRVSSAMPASYAIGRCLLARVAHRLLRRVSFRSRPVTGCAPRSTIGSLGSMPTRLAGGRTRGTWALQFETLHPFSDGNGRIGRLVIVLQLMQYSTLRQPLLIVSPWIEARRSRYQDGLVALSRTGDWSTWVEFFAEGLREQAIETHRQAEALLQYRESVRARIRAGEFRGVAGRIAEDLIETPVVTPTWAKARYGVSYQAANTAISKLITEGLLVEVTGRTYGRIFAAPAVYSALGVLELGR